MWGWISAGSPRIAYAGFQLAFAFFLCVVQGPAPAFDMVVARDRVIGILIGNLAMFAVSTFLWPVSLRPRIEAGIAKLLAGIEMLVSDPGVLRMPALGEIR